MLIERLHRRRQRVHGVVDDGAALAAGGARIAAGGDVERDRQVDVLDAVPQRLELAQVVVQVLVVGRPEDGLARQRQATEAERGAALDLGDRPVEVGGRHAGHRHQLVVVRAERLPGPVVVDPAHGLAELGVPRCPDGEALVREQHLGVDAVEGEIADAVLGRPARLVAQQLVALERHVLELRGPEPLGLLELIALGVDDDAGQPIAVASVHAGQPQVAGLLHVAVGRRHVVLVGGVGPSRAQPALVPRRLEPPDVVGIRLR